MMLLTRHRSVVNSRRVDWPSLFLIDKHGHLRYTQIGEGAYATTERAIQDLLKETYRGED